MTKGLLVALLAGVMSACFALGLDAGTPIKEAALAGGVEGLYAGLPVIFLVTFGGFLTNAVYCLQQNVANKSMGDYAKGKVWGNNLVFVRWLAYYGTCSSSDWKWVRVSLRKVRYCWLSPGVF